MLCSGWGRWRKAGATAMLVLAASLGGLSSGVTQARTAWAVTPIDTVFVAQLPPQGRNMLMKIYRGDSFRHDKDGVVFANRERILPASARGYYREYTVRTPGERSRGARRIVCGGLTPAAPDACYYSDDHYASFRKIIH